MPRSRNCRFCQGAEALTAALQLPVHCRWSWLSSGTNHLRTASAARIGIASAILASLCWGAATVLSKIAVASVSPVLLLVLQLLASVIPLWLIVIIRRIPMLSPDEFRPVAKLGLLEPGLAFLLTLIGLTDLKAGGASLIQSTESIMIVAVSAVLLGVRPTASFIAYSCLAFVGLVLALGLTNPEDMKGNGLFGIAALIAGTATAAIYVVLSSKIAGSAHPVVFVAVQQTVSLFFALAVLPFELMLQGHGPVLPDTTQLWFIVAVSGILQYAMAFTLYIGALANISANFAGIFLNLIPVFGLAGAYMFLGENLSPLQLLGTAMTICEVLLISRSEHGAKA